MTSQELGQIGEAYVMRQLQRAGLEVEQGGPADLVANGLPVEIKAARPRPYRSGGYRGFQFCLSKPGHTDHTKAAVVIMLAYWDPASDPVAFIVPVEALGTRRKVVIPTAQPWMYGGQWARFYRRWELLADLLEGAR